MVSYCYHAPTFFDCGFPSLEHECLVELNPFNLVALVKYIIISFALSNPRSALCVLFVKLRQIFIPGISFFLFGQNINHYGLKWF